jgi:hypothetical protein
LRRLEKSGATRCGVAPANVSAFVFAGATPDTAVLIGGQGEIQTLFANSAVGANGARANQQSHRFAGIANREEQFGIDVSTFGVYSPGVVSGSKGEALSEN